MLQVQGSDVAWTSLPQLEEVRERGEKRSSKLMSICSCATGAIFIASVVLTAFCFQGSLFNEEIHSSSQMILKVVFIGLDVFSGVATLFFCKKCITGRGSLHEKICFCSEEEKMGDEESFQEFSETKV